MRTTHAILGAAVLLALSACEGTTPSAPSPSDRGVANTSTSPVDAAVLVGTYDVSYRTNAGGCPPPNANPYFCVSIAPGPIHISTLPSGAPLPLGRYRVEVVSGGRQPGNPSVWDGDASGGTRYPIFPLPSIDFDHTGGEITLYHYDWVPSDNDDAVWRMALYRLTPAPTASAGGPYSGAEGSSIAFDGSTSSDAGGGALSYAWTFGDGATATGPTPTHAYADNGTYAVTLTVTNGGGAAATSTTTATVSNVAPTIKTLKLDAAILNTPAAGQTFPMSFVWSDRGTNDAPWSYQVDWGDGSATTAGTKTTQTQIDVSHVYAAPGSYTATFRLTDKDGGAVAKSVPVTARAPLAAVTASSIITTWAGTGVGGYSGDGGPATSAMIDDPGSMARGPDGSIFISTAGDGRIRRVTTGGVITTVAGSAGHGCGGYGGPATSAELYWPHGDAVGPDGTIYIADYGCGVLLKVTPDGILRLIPGAQSPAAVALGPDGLLYYVEYNANTIVRVEANGSLTRVAGTVPGADAGDGGPALGAVLDGPQTITFGPDGSLYIAEVPGHRIRRVAPNGTISTIAGTGVAGFSGDGGPATSAQLNFPYNLKVGPDGALYFVDVNNRRVRRIGVDGVITTVVGDGSAGSGGDGGPAGLAQLALPYGVAFTADGALLVADYNQRVRRVK